MKEAMKDTKDFKVEGLKCELKECEMRVKGGRKRIEDECKNFFDNATADQRKQFIPALLQRCIIPRIRISAMDAIFCSKFVEVLHSCTEDKLFNIIVFFQRLVILSKLAN